MAFPKNQAAADLVSDAPTFVPQEQLDELSIKTVEITDKEQ
jgi:aspartyl-tRNA synthetase